MLAPSPESPAATLASKLLAFAHDYALATLAQVASLSTLTILCGFALVLVLEAYVMGWPSSSLKRLTRPSRSTLADLFYFGGTTLGYQPVLVLVWTLGLDLVARMPIESVRMDLLGRIESPVLGVVLAVLAADFTSYWAHRARHAFGFWWEVHKVHHAAEQLNVITFARAHPLDLAWLGLVNAYSAAIVGTPHAHPIVFLVINGLLAVHAGLTHSMLPWSWGWFGRYVLFAPAGHRLHHSSLPEHHGHNFGTIFPIWDLMFGTLYRGPVAASEVGLPDEGHNRRGIFLDMLVVARRSALAAIDSVSQLVRRVSGRSAQDAATSTAIASGATTCHESTADDADATAADVTSKIIPA